MCIDVHWIEETIFGKVAYVRMVEGNQMLKCSANGCQVLCLDSTLK